MKLGLLKVLKGFIATNSVLVKGLTLNKTGTSVILTVAIIAALICAAIVGYIWISKPTEEEPEPSVITSDEATQILLDNIIKPDELNYDLIAFMWPEPLNLGDTITPHDILGDTYVIEENTWFFWVNDFPFALFSHPTRYVFIDASTGDYTIEIEGWWPQLNEEDLWGTHEEYWNKDYWVYSTYENSPSLTGPSSRIVDSTGSTGANPSGGNRALIIEGSMGSNMDIPTSAGEWYYLMENVFGFDVTALGPLENEAPTENNIDNIMDNLGKEMKPCENLSIYITGHGRENDGAVDMGNGYYLTPEQFSKWVCRIENGTHISVTVAACYSGKWINALKKWDNKVEIIYTSTDENGVGWGDVDHKNTTFAKYREAVDNGDANPDPNPDDIGLEAISGLVEDMEALVENFKRGDISWVTLWQEAIKTAKEKDAAFKNPAFFKKWTENNRPDLYPPCSGKGVENPQEWKSDKARDITPPGVVSTSPKNMQGEVPVDTPITVTFSEGMNKTATQNAFLIYPQVDGEFSWIGNTMIFMPHEKLFLETFYEVMISADAMDMALNNLEDDYFWAFWTQWMPPEGL